MTDSTRLLVNTLAQNIRTLVNIGLSLYATRIVMDLLGQSDYGIYMLVAGIVSLLSYLVNALVATTQRHLSYTYGQKDIQGAKLIFANSYIIHWIAACVLCALAWTATSLVFDYGWLNIPADKITESKYVYVLVVTSVFLTFITAPFRALLIAHENIVYISIVDVLDGCLKLGLVFTLYMFSQYRLPIYAGIISTVMLVNLLLLAGYSAVKYPECILWPRLKYYRQEIMQKIVGFATWTLYGTLCVFLRTQGLAVVFNRVYGLIINAAFGVAMQVYGSIQFLSEAILNAIRPQVIKAEGQGDRQRMLHLSENASRYSFFLLSLVAIPLMVEMPSILKLWLGNVPEHAVMFCRALFIGALLDQLTVGLTIANSAIGRIRNYTLLIYTIKVSTIPLILLVLHQGATVQECMVLYIVMEFLSSVARIPYLVRTAKLQVWSYIKNVYLRVAIPVAVMVVASIACVHLGEYSFRFLLTGVVSVLTGGIAILLVGISKSERTFIRSRLC